MNDVWRIPTGTNCPGYIPLYPECINLLGEDLIKALIIGHAGEDRSVSGEGHCWKRGTRFHKTIDELRSDMLRVCCATTVSKQEYLVTRSESIRNGFHHANDCIQWPFKKLPSDTDVDFQKGSDLFLQVSGSPRLGMTSMAYETHEISSKWIDRHSRTNRKELYITLATWVKHDTLTLHLRFSERQSQAFGLPLIDSFLGKVIRTS